MEQHLDASDISQFLGGLLSPERSAEVARHLGQCQACAERMSDAPSLTQHGGSTQGSAGEPSGVESVRETRPPERGEQVGRYLILERVGQGGMGIVYAAWDPDLGRRVAIKLLRPDKQSTEGWRVGQARLMREARAMARLNHPQVITVHDVGELGEGIFVAMEFVDGTTLRGWVKETPRPWRQVLDIFLAAGRGLAGAHAAGLVHRDFKPDNVLLGKDGRVRVTDFGLARQSGDAEAPSARPALPEGSVSDESPDLDQLTQHGVAVGTLMFMSPEQLRGEAPDAKADQFSFCVALYWALYGVWPFDRQRSTQRGLGTSRGGGSRASDLPSGPRTVDPTTGAFEPPKDAKVPAFLRRAILRGLAPEPSERFASMEDLLERLEYKPRRLRIAAAAASLALVAGLGAYGWMAHQAAQHHALLCTGAERQLAGIWDDKVRGEVTAALVGTGQPQAADVASRATHLLDEYTHDWVEASTEACRATRLRGEQTEALLSLRVVCLERRLKDVQGVTSVLATADAKLLPKAVDTVALLPSLRGCADVTSLSQVEPPPDSPKTREEINRLSGELARLKAMTDAGRYKQGRELTQPVLTATAALGYKPLQAEALLGTGQIELRSGAPAEAQKHLVQAFRTALASHHDVVLTRSASMLVIAIGSDMKRLDEALEWSGIAQSALEKMGGNDELEGELLNYVGVVRVKQQQVPEALKAFQRALQLTEHALGPNSIRRASILTNMASAYKESNQLKEASRVLGEALTLRERLSGPDHPMTGIAHYTLAQVFSGLEDFPQAETHARRALEINTAIYGPEHPETADTYDMMGELYLSEKKYREARETYEKSLAIKEKVLGKDDPSLGYTVGGLAMSLLELKDGRRAQPLFERTLKLTTDPHTRAETTFGLAQTLELLGKPRPQVLKMVNTARELFKSTKDDPKVVEVDKWLAEHPGTTAKKRARTARHP